MIPHIPPTIITFAMTDVLNATAMASAVTRPVPVCDAAMASGLNTRPTAMITSE